MKFQIVGDAILFDGHKVGEFLEHTAWPTLIERAKRELIEANDARLKEKNKEHTQTQ